MKFTAPALRMESIAHAPSEGAPVVDWGWNYDIWERGRHKPNTKNIKVFVQGLRKIRLIRDHDKDLIPANSGVAREQTGKGINSHPASYKAKGAAKATKIGTWSTGCIVVRSATDYYDIYHKVVDSGQKVFDLPSFPRTV